MIDVVDLTVDCTGGYSGGLLKRRRDNAGSLTDAFSGYLACGFHPYRR